MWDALLTQVFSFWLISCIFGCYFALESPNQDW
jgi:hypothetical protein